MAPAPASACPARRRAGCPPWLLALFAILALLAACRPEPPAAAPGPPHFTDVAAEAGLTFRHGAFRWSVTGDPVAMMGGGLCWLDYDNDGWLDLFAVNSYAELEAGRWESEGGGLPRSALFRNEAGRFHDVSQAAGADLPLRGNGCVAADLNLDGWTDLYITTARFNALLWNNGDGTFHEAAEAAGVDLYGWSTAAAVGDLNGDGWPDLFVAGYVDLNHPIESAAAGFPNSHNGRPDMLYLNDGPRASGRITFTEVGEIVGLHERPFEYGLGALLSDVDGDGDLDLFVANDTNPNRLYENVPWPGGPAADPQGVGFRFAEIGRYAGIDDRNSGMGVASGDYDADGRFDLVVTNMGPQLHSVYQNRSAGGRDAAFQDAARGLGVGDFGVGRTGWGIAWADFDLDADLDLFVANGAVPVTDPPADGQPLQLLANLTAQGMPGRFQDLTDFGSFQALPPLLARGSAVADYDNDGDLDVAVSTIGGRLALLRNDTQGGNWLAVELGGFHPGALVTATLPGGRQLLCETRAGSSYLSSEDPRCHFGLGAAGRVDELTVRWPGGRLTRLHRLRANRVVEIDPPRPVAPPDPGAPPAAADVLFEILLKEGGARPLVMLPRPSPELFRLGEALFWDKELSGNRDVACATCHHPVAGTGDGLSVSVGVGGAGFATGRQLGAGRSLIPRNATELYNRGVEGWETMFWDGRVAGLYGEAFDSPAHEALPPGLANVLAVQAMFPVTSRDEMRGEPGDADVFGRPNELAAPADDDFPAVWAALMDRLLAIPGYEALFAAAYPNVDASALGFQHAANAIAAYEMVAFTHADSPWDRYLAGDAAALPADALRGARLFYGEAGCGRCHNGPLLTDQEFHNIGIPQLGPGKGEDAPLDYGHGALVEGDDQMYAFRTPPLRNVALTGPWMHNGAYATLEAAVRHHLDPAAAFRNYDLSQLTPAMQATVQDHAQVLDYLDPLLAEPIALTADQVADLLAFLQALTSPSAANGCPLIPDAVPSGLPVDVPPPGTCPS